MDITSIIITIAVCIAALIVLYFLIAGAVFLIASKSVKKTAKKWDDDFNKGFDSDFFKRNRR